MHVTVDQEGSYPAPARLQLLAGLHTVAPLLQACYNIQSQCAFSAWNTADPDTDTLMASSSSSSSGTSSSNNEGSLISRVAAAVFAVNVVAGDLLFALCKMMQQDQETPFTDSNSDALARMLSEPMVPVVLLQQLAALAMLLHEEHVSLLDVAEQQQQQQQQPALQSSSSSQPAVSSQSASSSSSSQQANLGQSSSSSSSQQADPGQSSSSSSRQQADPGQSSSSSSQQAEPGRRQPSKQKFCADLLDVPPFHLDMQQHRPDLASETYWDAARAYDWSSAGEKWLLYSQRAGEIVYALDILMRFRYWIHARSSQQQGFSWRSWLMSTEVHKLALELQLLAAAFVQRQRRQGAVLDAVGYAGDLLVSSNRLHHDIILACMQHGLSRMPSGLLRQCGLQMLQALAAPVQQLLLQPGDAIGEYLRTAVHGGQQQQLYALRVALSGCAVVQRDDPDVFTCGELRLNMVEDSCQVGARTHQALVWHKY
jgi:hypothetical protein